MADPEYREKHQASHRVANMTPEQREKRRARDARYAATAKRWAAWRRYNLRGERERIQSELDDLHREEMEWLTKLDTTTQTR